LIKIILNGWNYLIIISLLLLKLFLLLLGSLLSFRLLEVVLYLGLLIIIRIKVILVHRYYWTVILIVLYGVLVNIRLFIILLKLLLLLLRVL